MASTKLFAPQFKLLGAGSETAFKQDISEGNILREGNAVIGKRSGIRAVGEYRDYANGKLLGITPNIVPDQALNYLLNSGVRGATQQTSWFMALFSGTTIPANTLTAGTFAATQNEITSNTEGYTEAARPSWTTVDSTVQELTNAASLASFTIATATSLTVRGAAILSDSVRGGTTGVLLTAATYASPRILNNGIIYDVTYLLRLTG